jgi:hypothetical protein
MSTAPTAPPAGPPPAKREITLISHSPLFYWWPIWFLGYIMALITAMENHRLAIVPAGAKLVEVSEKSDDKKKTYELSVPSPTTKSLNDAVTATGDPTQKEVFKTKVSQRAWMGPVYCVVLLLTIVITNVPLRGLWSFLVIMLLVILALIFTVFDVWNDLLKTLGDLHVYINMAGYLFIASAVLVLWVVSVFIFDQRTYMRITPGQIQVCEHIGASIRNYDTTGLAFEKQRDDLFRHWILGFFSGDLIVRTAGAERETIRLPNVLWIGWRLEEVQDLLREKSTVQSTGS